MNYQATEMTNTIKLQIGDVIRDQKLKTNCKVDRISDTHVRFSEIEYFHPYEFVKFGVKLFETLKENCGIESIRFNTGYGNLKIDSQSNKSELYRKLLIIESDSE